jgi:hypothetical protein
MRSFRCGLQDEGIERETIGLFMLVAALRGRRHDLGIGVRDMAAGLGMELRRLLSVEDGTATEEDGTFYRTWLSRIEGWSSGQRHMQVGRASPGQRFT